MYLGVDTNTWLKIFRIEKDFNKILDSTIIKFNVFLTHDVLEECLFHAPDRREFFKKMTIFPKLNKLFQYYKSLGFDNADASLLEYADENIHPIAGEKYIIITEDPAMLKFNVYGKLRIIKFIDWLNRLYDIQMLTKKQLTFLTNFLFKSRNITKRKKDRILSKF